MRGVTVHDRLVALGADDQEAWNAETLLARVVPLGRPVVITDEVIAAARTGDAVLLAMLLAQEVAPDSEDLAAIADAAALDDRSRFSPNQVRLSNVMAVLGSPKRSGERIAPDIQSSWPSDAHHSGDASSLRSSEQWFIWDCSGVWDDFERFQSSVLEKAAEAASLKAEQQRQLGNALAMLRAMSAELFCVAIEEDDAPSAAPDMVTLVNVCLRHR
jgi:hypothetical protein